MNQDDTNQAEFHTESPRQRAEAWTRRAVPEVVAAWERRGAAYARRLAAQALPRDPVGDLLTLAARRVLPLEARVRRPLSVAELPPMSRALLGLTVADRRVLLEDSGVAAGEARREHLAAALWRLTTQTKAVRRLRDAPPGGDP